MKHLKQPIRKEQEGIISWLQQYFGSGMYKDAALPATEIPSDGVRLAYNVLLYPKHGEVRPGTELWSNLQQPALVGRTGYSATKTGYIITKTAGEDFTQQDVDSYFVWPVSRRRDLIVEVIDSDNIRVKHDTAESPATAGSSAHLCGPENARKFWHTSSQRLFAYFDNRVFWTT